MATSTVPADPRLRERALILMLIAVVVSTLFLPFFRGFLHGVESLVDDYPQLVVEKLRLIRNITLGFTLVCATILAGVFVYIAARVFRAGQWPPPGWRVVVEMRVRTGRQAAAVAVFFLFLAVFALADVVWLWSLPGPAEPHALPMQEV